MQLKKLKEFKYLKMSISLILAIAIIITTFIILNFNLNTKPIAYINNTPISVDEFDLFKNKYKSKVYAQFRDKYNVEEQKNFWTTSFDGEIPIDVVKRMTLKHLSRVKTEQNLMLANGVIQDASYETFLKELKEENEKRKTAKENKQIFYGPTKFNKDTYFEYVHSKRLIELRDKYKKQLDLSDSILKTFYNDNKDIYPEFKKADIIETETIKINISEDKKAAFSNAEKAINDLKEISFDKAMKKYNQDNQVINNTYDESTIMQNVKYETELFTVISKLNPNDISDITEYNGAYYIVKCLSKQDGGYKDFDSYKAIISSRYIDSKFEIYISDNVSNAKIEVDTNVYGKIKP